MQTLAWRYTHFRSGEQPSEVVQPMRLPKVAIETPRPAQLDAKAGSPRGTVTTNRYEGDSIRSDALEDIASHGRCYVRLTENKQHRLFKFLEVTFRDGLPGYLTGIILGEMKAHLIRGQPVVWDAARWRGIRGRISRAFAFQEIGVRCVGKIVQLFRLPRAQTLGEVRDPLAITWR